MSLANSIKPISYVKANAAEIIDKLAERGEPLIITKNGEAKAVIVDIVSWEKTQETMALLKILALGRKEIAEGKTRPAREVIGKLRADLRARYAER